MSELLTWVETYGWWIFAASATMLLLGLVLVPALILYIPGDYFVRDQPPEPWRHQHPVVRGLFLVGKNLLGVLFLLAGLIMLFTPGQGILTILLSLMLLNFPGKRKLERRLVRLPLVLKTMNRLRTRWNYAPLLAPRDDEQGAAQPPASAKG